MRLAEPASALKRARSRPSELKAALGFVADHCDVVERLRSVPPSARVRGLYFRSLEKLLAREGKLVPYHELCSDKRHSPLRMYPLSDYMVRLAVAGACLSDQKHLHEGMHEVWRHHATDFAASILGRAMLRFLSNDPVRLTEQGLAARRQTFQYGHWRIVRHGPRRVEMIYEEEYIWIQSAIAGGAVGTFESCGLEVETETTLKDRFNGSTMIRW